MTLRAVNHSKPGKNCSQGRCIAPSGTMMPSRMQPRKLMAKKPPRLRPRGTKGRRRTPRIIATHGHLHVRPLLRGRRIVAMVGGDAAPSNRWKVKPGMQRKPRRCALERRQGFRASRPS